MSEIDHLLTEAAKAVLTAARPEALPETVAIRGEGDTDTMLRPVIVFAIGEAESRHPRVRVGRLDVKLHVRVDDVTAEQSAAWHEAATGFFRENPAALAATLAPHGLLLQKLVAGTGMDALEENRGRIHTMPFLFVVRRS
jgi:hypothetical protein